MFMNTSVSRVAESIMSSKQMAFSSMVCGPLRSRNQDIKF
jgi:hypothetical protein